MTSEARLLHQQSFEAREIEGNLLKSLNLADQALIEYLAEGDILGASEVMANRSITFRHLFQQTGKRDFLYAAKGQMIAAVDMVRASDNQDALAIPLFELAKTEEALEDYSQAIIHYQEAINSLHIDPTKQPDVNNPAHNRPAQLADMKVHLSYAEYKNGDKTAKERMRNALNELEQAEEVDPDTKNVWLSGGYMSMAEMVKTEDREEAKQYLEKGKQFITGTPRLQARRKQWESLNQELNNL